MASDLRHRKSRKAQRGRLCPLLLNGRRQSFVPQAGCYLAQVAVLFNEKETLVNGSRTQKLWKKRVRQIQGFGTTRLPTIEELRRTRCCMNSAYRQYCPQLPGSSDSPGT